MGKKTRLWYVYVRLESEGPSSPRVVVVVSDRDPGTHDTLRIRTITPNAAGRKYARHNLHRRLAEMLVDPGTAGQDWDVVERYRNIRPVIRVLKGET